MFRNYGRKSRKKRQINLTIPMTANFETREIGFWTRKKRGSTVLNLQLFRIIGNSSTLLCLFFSPHAILYLTVHLQKKSSVFYSLGWRRDAVLCRATSLSMLRDINFLLKPFHFQAFFFRWQNKNFMLIKYFFLCQLSNLIFCVISYVSGGGNGCCAFIPMGCQRKPSN